MRRAQRRILPTHLQTIALGGIRLQPHACSGPTSMLETKEVVAVAGNFQSQPVLSCSWDHHAALFSLSMVSSLVCRFPCFAAHCNLMHQSVPKELIALPCCCGFFPHTKQNTKACVERPVAPRYILSLVRVLGKSTEEADFCLTRGRKRGRQKPRGIPFVILPSYFPLEQTK